MSSFNDDYDSRRRRRRWATGPQGLQGYAAFLAGDPGDPSAQVGAIVGAEEAAYLDQSGSSPWRSIMIGVATGAATFLVNRWLGKVLG